jgi:hypothetical protein
MDATIDLDPGAGDLPDGRSIELTVPDLRVVVAKLLADLDLDTARDAAAVALARHLAEEIQAESANVGFCSRHSVLKELAPILLKTLSELGGTPLGRKLLDKTSGEKQGGRLSQLRNGLTGEEQA